MFFDLNRTLAVKGLNTHFSSHGFSLVFMTFDIVGHQNCDCTHKENKPPKGVKFSNSNKFNI